MKYQSFRPFAPESLAQTAFFLLCLKYSDIITHFCMFFLTGCQHRYQKTVESTSSQPMIFLTKIPIQELESQTLFSDLQTSLKREMAWLTSEIESCTPSTMQMTPNTDFTVLSNTLLTKCGTILKWGLKQFSKNNKSWLEPTNKFTMKLFSFFDVNFLTSMTDFYGNDINNPDIRFKTMQYF